MYGLSEGKDEDCMQLQIQREWNRLMAKAASKLPEQGEDLPIGRCGSVWLTCIYMNFEELNFLKGLVAVDPTKRTTCAMALKTWPGPPSTNSNHDQPKTTSQEPADAPVAGPSTPKKSRKWEAAAARSPSASSSPSKGVQVLKPKGERGRKV